MSIDLRTASERSATHPRLEYASHDRTAAPVLPSALVTVGTERFDALVAEVDRLVLAGRLAPQTFGQIGSGSYQPRHFAWVRYERNLWARLSRADLIITHGGTGLVMECIHSGRPFIAVADERKVGNHQREFLEALADRFDFCWVRDPRELEAVLPAARAARPRKARDVHELAQDVLDFVQAKTGKATTERIRQRPRVSSSGFLRRLAVAGASALTRRCHGLPGRWRLVRWLQSQDAIFRQIAPRTVGIGNGLYMSVDPVDENGRWAYVHGLQPAERIARQFVRLLRRGDNVLDIGANLGYLTLVAAWRVGPRGCVHAFEPNPQVLRRLRANAALNPRFNIRVHGQAVTDRCGQARLFLAFDHRTGHSSLRNLGAEAAQTALVETTTIDTLLDRLPPIRLVKLDIEGAELRALHGMIRCIQRDRPFILTECNNEFLTALGGSANELCHFLTSRNYRLFRIGAAGRLEPLAGVPTDHCDLLACPGPAAGSA